MTRLATGNIEEDPPSKICASSQHARLRFPRSSSDALHRRVLRREQVKKTPELLANASPEERQPIIDWVKLVYESEDEDEIEDD